MQDRSKEENLLYFSAALIEVSCRIRDDRTNAIVRIHYVRTYEFFIKISEKTLWAFIRGFIARRRVVSTCRLSHIHFTSLSRPASLPTSFSGTEFSLLRIY